MTYLEHLDGLAGQAPERLARGLVNAWPQIREALTTAKALSEAHKEWARTLGPGSDAHLVAIGRQEFAHRAANRALEGMFAQAPEEEEEEGVAARPTVVCPCGSNDAAPGDVALAGTDEETNPVAVVGLYRGEPGIERMEIALGLAAARLVVERWEVQRYDGPIQMWRRMPHGAAECVLAGTGR